METPAKTGINERVSRAYNLCALGFDGISNVASIGAGVANTTVQGYTCYPCVYKIAKVVVSLTAIDAVAGLDSFNLVVGGLTGQTAQTYSQNNATPADNSYYHNPANVVGSDSLGYPTNIAVAGMTVFANDVPFNSANSYATNTAGIAGDLTGLSKPNTGWLALATTTGGYGIFVPTSHDGVYPEGVPLSLRVTTVASTGSITNLKVSLLVEPMGHSAGPPVSATYYAPSPGQDF